MTTETISIELVHTASDEHYVTAFDANDDPISSLKLTINADGEVTEIGDTVEGISDERTATLACLEWDGDINDLHKAMTLAADNLPGIDESDATISANDLLAAAGSADVGGGNAVEDCDALYD